MIGKSHLCPPGTLTEEVDAASTVSASFFWSRRGPIQAQVEFTSVHILSFHKFNRLAPAAVEASLVSSN